MSTIDSLRLFQAFGVELEYMIVDAQSLDVRSIADELLRDGAGTSHYVGEVEGQAIGWSNELVAHVVELKTGDPAASLAGLAAEFHEQIARINRLLAPRSARLLPGGMHPWMDPAAETRLWPHEYNQVYACFDKVFDCRGHGWSNLQSVHLNLPFADDDEFGRLHAAIRVILPLLPALAASSPIVEGRTTGTLDSRLEVYRGNSRRVPSVAGQIIPEPVYSIREYQEQILGRMYRDIAPHDPHGVLQHEWLNARGAIARFERNTIEIRVLDVQECPTADLAICGLASAALRALADERFATYAEQAAWSVARLEPIFLATVRDAEQAAITDRDYLGCFGMSVLGACQARDVWRHIGETLVEAGVDDAIWRQPLTTLLAEGTLARRILRALELTDRGPHPAGQPINRQALGEVYRRLADCLARDEMFVP